MPAKPSELDLNDAPAKASKLFLVDANGLMYRAFFALPEELATTDGLARPTRCSASPTC